MIVDTSAVAAIVLGEPEREPFYRAMADAPSRRISAASVVELIEVYARKLRLEDPRAQLLADLTRMGLSIVPVTAEQAHVAVEARLQYGKGRHRAALNFGDSFVYALAKVTDEPLLFKGDDFAHTDVRTALPQV